MLIQENMKIYEEYANNTLKRVQINNDWVSFYYPRSDFRLTSWINNLNQHGKTTQEILSAFFKKITQIGFQIKDVAPNSYKITQ